jgi:prophage tail gpP-like protein
MNFEVYVFRNDKLMLKIAKKRSDIVKRLLTMGPCYSSKNTVDGKTDCLKLFPDDYCVEEEEPENESIENESKKKKKKRRKKRDKGDGEPESQSATGDQISAQDSEDTLDGNYGFFSVKLRLNFL